MSVLDTFTDVNGTLMSAHVADSGQGYDPMNWAVNLATPPPGVSAFIGTPPGVLLAGGATNAGGPTWRNGGDPGDPVYRVGATMRFSNTAATHRRHALFLAMTPTGSTLGTVSFIQVLFDNDTNPGEVQIVENVAGGSGIVALATITGIVLAGQTFLMEAEYDSTTGAVTVRSNGVTIGTTTSTVHQIGRVGVATSRGSADHFIDDFYAEPATPSLPTDQKFFDGVNWLSRARQLVFDGADWI